MPDLLPFPSPSEPTPTPAAAPPPDAAARTRALDTTRSFIVEAPAGSGKTALLIQRYLKLLADPSVTAPEQVLAITFTNKAAAELRDRVLTELGAPGLDSQTWDRAPQISSDNPTTPDPHNFTLYTRHLAHSVLARSRALGWDILAQPRRLNIRTIDSVCSEIARTLPILSGSGGRLTPSTDARPLHREAARRTLLLLGSNTTGPAFQSALRHLLLHRDANLANAEALLAEMLALRDQWASLIPLATPLLDDACLDAEVLPRLERALAHAISTDLTRLAEAFPPGTFADLCRLAGHLGHAAPYKPGIPSPIAPFAGLHNPPAPTAENLGLWLALIHLLTTQQTGWRARAQSNFLKFHIDKQQAALLTAILDSLRHRDDLLLLFARVRTLPPARYPANQWAIAKSLFRVLSRALVELQFVFAARNQCDFTELTLLARHALTSAEGPEDLARALGARLQHLLVDEMQDTSTPQYDLIQLLTASWDGHSQTLFLVGDPRQSIYLFRHARVERFLATFHSARLGDLPLTPLRLTANFRSQQHLVDQFNQTFARIFPPNPNSTPDLPYHPVHATLPPSSHATGLHWHPAPAPQPHPTAGHPHHIRRLILQWLAKPLPPGRTEPWRIAILVRNRADLAPIVPILQLADADGPPIPLRAVNITPLAERPEVLDLTALTRALLHPADRIATLAILRAPWCGLSLPDLHLLTGADPSPESNLRNLSIASLIATRAHLLPLDSRTRLQHVQNILTHAQSLRARLTPAQLVLHAWRALGGDTYLTPAELANSIRFFTLLDTLQAEVQSESASAALDLTLLQSRLKELYAEPEPIPPNSPVVDLLTIHTAKGLEWDVVFVPALHRIPPIDQYRLLTWAELDPIESIPSALPAETLASNRNTPTLFDLAASAEPDPTAAIMLAPIAARGDDADPLTKWLRSLHAARSAAERKRLFYVAATRARHELHLFAAPTPNAAGEINPRRGSLLDAAWSAAQTHFTPTPSASTTTPATLVPFAPSATPTAASPGFALELAAAAADSPAPPPTAFRLPLTSLHPPPLTSTEATPTHGAVEKPASASLDPLTTAPVAPNRPEGSFAARAFGTTVHTFIEYLTTRIAHGDPPAKLLAELPTLAPRITALLRAHGLPPATVTQIARDTRAALQNLLRDPDGLWLLQPHPAAASELALTTLSLAAADAPSTLRIDRTFLAGPEPGTQGNSHLWIVDFKTSSHSSSGIQSFLEAQRTAYAPQLESYAQILTQPTPTTPKPNPNPTQTIQNPTQIRLALYFPTLPHLLWWPF